jgi:hypothetical protein
MARKRISIALENWPAADRSTFERALVRGGLFERCGLAAHWAAKTRLSVVTAYGHWLEFLTRTGHLKAETSPASRVSGATLGAYIQELEKRLSAVTVATRIRDLEEALRVMDAGEAHALVRRAYQTLRRRAKAGRHWRQRLVAPSELYWAGVARMERNRVAASNDKTAALRFSRA